MHSTTRGPLLEAILRTPAALGTLGMLAVFAALAAFPLAALTQTSALAATPDAGPGNAPRFVLEIEGGAGHAFVDTQKWSETTSPLFDWNTTAYLGGARFFFTRAGSLRLGADAGYNYFFWYTSTGAGYKITYEPHATRVGAVVRAVPSPRIAADGGLAAYIFSDGTVLGANAAVGYFVPMTPKVSIPVRIRVDFPFTSVTPLATVSGTVGLSYRY